MIWPARLQLQTDVSHFLTFSHFFSLARSLPLQGVWPFFSLSHCFMKFTEAVPEIKDMLESDLPRSAVVKWLEQSANISTATAYRWISKAESGPVAEAREQAVEALLGIMAKRSSRDDDTGVIEVAALLLKARG